MRVEGPTQINALSGMDALTRMKRYLSALRRRWYLILIPGLLGAALGWFTTPDATEIIRNTKRYYRASHVLIIDQGSSSSTEGATQVNLSQAAYLVTTGDIPDKVAKRIDVPVSDVRDALLALPRDSVQAVEIQTVGTTDANLVKMADAAAEELLAKLLADAQADADAERDRVITELSRLDEQIAGLNQQIAANPPNLDQLVAQQRSVVNQYSLAYEQFAQLANRPPPTAGLVSLEGAKVQDISKTEFNRTKDSIREGAAFVTGVAQDTTTGSSAVATPSTGAGAKSRATMGGLAGLALGIALVLLWDRFDSRLRRRDDVEAATGLTVVAEIPPLSRHEQHDLEVVAHTKIRSRAAEAYRVIRGAILFALGVDDPTTPEHEGAIVLMVTSANPAEGKTTTVANLAAVLAEGGLEVLVINCDFRRPRIHKYLQSPMADSPDQGEAIRIGSVVVSATKLPRVRLITGLGEGDADANPLEVVALQRRIIKATRSRFDVILLDTAPFLTTNDASELLSETDQVLVVVRSGKTRAEAAQRTVEVLARFEAPVLGIVMNDSEEAESAQYYYYGYST